MILVIDNYDSFTYNIVQYLGELGANVVVYRNDAIDLAGIERFGPEGILISPGPGTPDESGISLDILRVLGPSRRYPIFGVCLGHQAMGQVFGGKVVRAGRLMHGRTSEIMHEGHGVFRSLPNPFTATRYHSLIVDWASLPAVFEPTAWTAERELMGIKHRELPIEGVQFHPESFLTECGHQLLQNFLNDVKEFRA